MNAKSNPRIRLDHLLSRATDLSRKQAKIEIRKQPVDRLLDLLDPAGVSNEVARQRPDLHRIAAPTW